MLVISTLLLSIAFQGVAAVMAFRLIAITGRKTAWVLVSGALTLMAVRRIIPLSRLLTGDLSISPDPLNEGIGLALSIAMAFGIAKIAPLFIERQQAEKALRASEQRLAEAQRIAHLGHWELDLTSNVLFWSAEIYRIFEIDPDRFGASYEAFLNAIHPEDRPAVDAAYTKSLQSRTPYLIDHRLLFADGRVKFVREQCETYYDRDGRPLRSLGTVQDVTERKQAEEELRRAGAYNRRLIEASLDPLVTIGPDGKITDVNGATEEATGRSRSELLGTDFSDYFTEPEQARAGYQEVFRSGQVRDYPLELQHRDGHLTSVLYNAAVYRDESGAIAGVFAAARDVSARNQAEKALRQLSQRNEQILNSAGEGIYGTDIAGNIVFINPAALEMLGFRSEELLGKNSHLIFHHTRPGGQVYRIEECPLHKSLREGESHRGQDEVFWSRDGRRISVEHVNTPVLENGAVVGAVVVFRDIGERKKDEAEIRKLNDDLEQRVITRTADLENKSLELKESQQALMNIVEDLNEKSRELEQANHTLLDLDRLKSMFVASMSHELRTPLNSIIGFSSVILEEWLGPLNEEQKAKVAIVLRTGKHLLTLINDVIDVSKIEAGKLESHVEDFELREVVAEALELVRKEGEEKGLRFRDATTTLSLHSDRRRFFQCLVNLLSNAVKFSSQGEVAVVGSLVPGRGGGPDRVRISVRDCGIGIPEAELPRLFTAFTRIQSEVRDTVKGTGLGLYLVKKITNEILQGEVGVESTPGQGSIFSLTLPLRIEERSQKYDDRKTKNS